VIVIFTTVASVIAINIPIIPAVSAPTSIINRIATGCISADREKSIGWKMMLSSIWTAKIASIHAATREKFPVSIMEIIIDRKYPSIGPK
jgi:hypothetical protein